MKRTNIHLPEKLVDRVKEITEGLNISFAAFVRQAIKEAIRRHDRRKK